MDVETARPPLETDDLAPPSGPPARLPGRRAAWGVGGAALAVAMYLLTGIFTVAADEQAVIRRFGRVAARLGPGIHYRLPWPGGRRGVFTTTAVRKTRAGLRLAGGGARAGAAAVRTR